IPVCKCSEKLRPTPNRNRFQLRSAPDDIKAVLAKFQHEIAVVLSLSLFCFWKKFGRAHSQANIDLASFDELTRDLIDVVRVTRMCIKGRACCVRERSICHQTGSASTVARSLATSTDRFPVRLE